MKRCSSLMVAFGLFAWVGCNSEGADAPVLATEDAAADSTPAEGIDAASTYDAGTHDANTVVPRDAGGARDAGVATDAGGGDSQAPSTFRCVSGAACDGVPYCGATDGLTFQACDCDVTNHFVCGPRESVGSCGAPDPMACASRAGTEPKVLCGQVSAGSCTMSACKAKVGGATTGWGGLCELQAACLAPRTALCGTPCVPGASGCTCEYSVLTPSPRNCSCVAVGGSSLGGFWACP